MLDVLDEILTELKAMLNARARHLAGAASSASSVEIKHQHARRATLRLPRHTQTVPAT